MTDGGLGHPFPVGDLSTTETRPHQAVPAPSDLNQADIHSAREIALCTRDPSLRLKSGYARDDGGEDIQHQIANCAAGGKLFRDWRRPRKCASISSTREFAIGLRRRKLP